MEGSERLASRDEIGRQTCCNPKYAFAKSLEDSEKRSNATMFRLLKRESRRVG